MMPPEAALRVEPEVADVPDPRPPDRRRWPLSSGGKLGWGALLAVLVLWSLYGTGFSLGTLTSPQARANASRFLSEFLQPDLSGDYLVEVARAALETLQISIAGLAVGALFGIPLSLFAAANLSSGTGSSLPRWQRAARLVPYQLARAVLNILRAIPELVWALIFITAVGLGPFPGVLAIGVHSIGLLGKLWAEQLEAVDPAPVDAVRLLGVGRLGLAGLAVIPQARQNLVSLTLYQWECNVRAATVIGFVGAGGIGQQVDISIRLFAYSETATLILAIMVLVFFADGVSALIRRALR